MSKYLINETKVYRFDTESEAQKYVDDVRKSGYRIVSSKIEQKERKAKGEVIDAWARLTIKINYNDEKEPSEFADNPWEIPSDEE